jgi:hypothetical protein
MTVNTILFPACNTSRGFTLPGKARLAAGNVVTGRTRPFTETDWTTRFRVKKPRGVAGGSR